MFIEDLSLTISYIHTECLQGIASVTLWRQNFQPSAGPRRDAGHLHLNNYSTSEVVPSVITQRTRQMMMESKTELNILKGPN